jgi:hypothetical protein
MGVWGIQPVAVSPRWTYELMQETILNILLLVFSFLTPLSDLGAVMQGTPKAGVSSTDTGGSSDDCASCNSPRDIWSNLSVTATLPKRPPDLVDRRKGALLNIPPREQWLNDDGYCGETSIQSILLYFGGYASQAVIRESVGGEVVSENLERAIDNFAFERKKWKGGKDLQQLSLWMKTHLRKGHPLVGLVYITEMN